MSKMLFSTLAFAAIMTSPAFARHNEKSIVVQAGPSTLAQWSTGISRQLEGKLRYPQPISGELPATGIASIRFQCSPDGQPAGLVLSRKSGSRALDREAMRAIGAMESLHPMPPGMRPNQRFEANILFATSWSDYHRQMDQLQRDTARRNAWFKEDAPVIALNVGTGVPGRSR